MREFAKRMRKIRDGYIAVLKRIPAELAVNERYTFRLDQYVLEALYAELSIVVDSVLLEGGARDNWFLRAYAEVSYQRGTAQAHVNLAQQSEAYKAGRMSLDSLLRSPPYQARVALVRARAFEEMKGLAADVKARMGRILADGIGRGKNPTVIAKELTSQSEGISAGRARNIARAEIPMALRRARWDEKDQAEEDYGVQSKLMHISALSPTTRITHAARHAKLFTSGEVRDWYSKDGNGNNCKCAQTEVLVDDDGKPLVPGIQARARKNYDVMKKKGKGPWAKE
ncbi:phage head morphogenesis protein [Eoetvoesia caeni]|nr:phage head morphogenesis protein [Eoetvoesiella caeni]